MLLLFALPEVTSQVDWPSYNGGPNGTRYSPIGQITKANVSRLAPRWMFSIPSTARLQVTPVVVGSVTRRWATTRAAGTGLRRRRDAGAGHQHRRRRDDVEGFRRDC